MNKISIVYDTINGLCISNTEFKENLNFDKLSRYLPTICEELEINDNAILEIKIS